MLMSYASDSPVREDIENNGDAATLIKSTIDVLRRRWLVMAIAALVTFLLFATLIMLLPASYQAVAEVQLDPKPIAANGVSPDQSISVPDQSAIDTEVSVMGSRDAARAVVKQFHLDSDAEFTKGLDKGPPLSAAERGEVIVTKVLKKLSVAREKTTYIIDVGFTSSDADKSAAIANAFAENYMKATVARRSGMAEQRYSWLYARRAQAATAANAADAALAQYEARTGIVNSGVQGTITDQQVAPLSMQLATAKSDDAAARSNLAVARSHMSRGGATGASGVLNSPAIQQLRANRAQVQQTLSELSTRYGPRHPQTIQAEQQLIAVDSQIKEEAQRIIGELQAKASAADAQAGSLSGDLARLRAEQAGDARSAAQAESLKRDADTKHNAYNNLSGLIQQAESLKDNSIPQGYISQRATAPARPTSPKRALLFIIAVLFAGALGLGIITVQELMSPAILAQSDLERRIGVKYIASAPQLGRKAVQGQGLKSAADTLLAKPMSEFGEAFRVVRSSLMLGGDQAQQVIAVTSALPGEGKTTTSLSLARVGAMAGDRTLLIDCDIRRAGLSRTRRRPAIGLVEVLGGKATLADAIMADQVPNLDLLTIARPSFLPDDVFGSGAMRSLLDEVRGHYDRIILDTAPMLSVADARALTVLADAVVLVVRWNSTPRNAVQTAVEWLRVDHARLAGAMLSMVSPKSESMGGLYHARKYGQYYQAG